MRRSILYAPRIKGDLDLGLEPTRFDGAGNQLWAEIDAPGGRIPGQPFQGHWEASTTARYRIGSRRVVGDRTFHYAHGLLGDGNHIRGWGVANKNTVQERALATWAANGVVGNMTALLTATVVNVGLNQFAGGYLLYASVDGHSNQIPIVGNTAANIGSNFTVYLGHPLTGAATLGVTGSTCTGSIWGNAGRPTNSGFNTFIGIPICDLPDNGYAWIQTWGPCLVVGTGPTGGNANERTVCFNQGDGSIDMATNRSVNHQVAGVIASCSYYAGGGESTNWIILQLFP